MPDEEVVKPPQSDVARVAIRVLSGDCNSASIVVLQRKSPSIRGILGFGPKFSQSLKAAHMINPI